MLTGNMFRDMIISVAILGSFAAIVIFIKPVLELWEKRSNEVDLKDMLKRRKLKRAKRQMQAEKYKNLEDATAAKADYNGKANTAAIIAGYAALGKDMDSQDMCKVLETYNEGGYTDWYVPAAGQLYEFKDNNTAINEALTAISGRILVNALFWSSSEKSAHRVWPVDFNNGYVTDSKWDNNSVRFVRDLQ